MASPNQFYSSQARKNWERWLNATVNDLARKYGFDFSRGYAERQAEAEAARARAAYQDSLRRTQSDYEQRLAQIEQGIRDAVRGLEQNFFTNMLQQQQAQANTGINAGIAADQNLRLGMAAQSALADVYGQANLDRARAARDWSLESQRLKEALDLVEQERLARAEQLYQDLLQRGYSMLQQERSSAQSAAQLEWQIIADQIAQELQRRQLEQQAQLQRESMALQERLQRESMALQERLARLRGSGGSGGVGRIGGGSVNIGARGSYQDIAKAIEEFLRQQQRQQSRKQLAYQFQAPASEWARRGQPRLVPGRPIRHPVPLATY